MSAKVFLSPHVPIYRSPAMSSTVDLSRGRIYASVRRKNPFRSN
jgi:hypothetical protein